MSIPHCFAVTKEIVAGGGTSGILYSLFPKVIITMRRWDWYTSMVDLIIHHKHQEDKCHIIPHPWRAWCCREGDNVGWHGDLVLGEATRWCTVVGVLWSISPTASWSLLKWGSFGSHYRQWTIAGNPLPTYGSGRDTSPLDLLVPPSGSL